MGDKEATQEGVAQTPRGARRLLPPSTPVALRCAYLTERAVLPEEGRKRGSSGGPAQGSLGSPPQRPWGAGGPSARRDRRVPRPRRSLGSGRLPSPSQERGPRGPGPRPRTPVWPGPAPLRSLHAERPGWPSPQRPGSGRSCPHRNLGNVPQAAAPSFVSSGPKGRCLCPFTASLP